MIGTDIIENSRIASMINKNAFINRVLSFNERKIFDSYSDKKSQIEFIAGRFSAKESIIKASNKQFYFSKIEILRSSSGAPVVYYDSILKEDIYVSISHENKFTISFALILNNRDGR